MRKIGNLYFDNSGWPIPFIPGFPVNGYVRSAKVLISPGEGSRSKCFQLPLGLRYLVCPPSISDVRYGKGVRHCLKLPDIVVMDGIPLLKQVTQTKKIREQYLKAGQSFVTETVFSHESKYRFVCDAQKAGFEVILNHVHIRSAELAYKRVQDRVNAGGHDVPKDKVYSRYDRTVANIQKASMVADRTYIWDNSRQNGHEGVIPRFVMTLAKGRIIKPAKQIPAWAYTAYRGQIDKFQQAQRVKAGTNDSSKTVAT